MIDSSLNIDNIAEYAEKALKSLAYLEDWGTEADDIQFLANSCINLIAELEHATAAGLELVEENRYLRKLAEESGRRP